MEATKNNAQKVWAAVVRHAKEHHDSVNAAFITYYPQPLSAPASSSLYPSSATAPPPSTASSSPRCSFEKPEPIVITSAKSSRSSLGKAWDGVKQHIKAQNQTVKAARRASYGGC
ncbi:hypothetical protein NW762_013048 [Fusarium torreyae]|uniref:Uncharacterized protein n=1 Tax=Fusarium torreyae TaxID=1237075 RepID=A0A9W8RQP7_9HYPO|nr:hypothetical protein NW762_013048 [Fusarium torreyae]